MLKRIVLLGCLLLSFTLVGCNISPTAGLKPYVDAAKGYQFLYPVGWLPVQVSNGPDIVFHDIINESENVSVIINPVADQTALEDLGTPSEVGYELQKNAIAPAGSQRKAELVDADVKQVDDKTYYRFEYAVELPGQNRHDLAAVVVNRGKLYTFNASTTEQRWPQVKEMLTKVINSFVVY